MPAEQVVTAARSAPATPAGEIARVTQTEARVVHNGCGTRRPWWRLPEGSCSRGGSSTAADGYTGDNARKTTTGTNRRGSLPIPTGTNDGSALRPPLQGDKLPLLTVILRRRYLGNGHGFRRALRGVSVRYRLV